MPRFPSSHARTRTQPSSSPAVSHSALPPPRKRPCAPAAFQRDTSSTRVMDLRIQSELRSSEQAFLQVLAHEDDGRQFAERWSRTVENVVAALEAGLLSEHTARLSQSIVQRIGGVAARLVDMDRQASDITRRVVLESKSCLQERPPGSTPPTLYPASSTQQRLTPAPNDLLLAPYRRWFLDHFAFPYLTSADKKALHLAVPSQSESQCATWFINTRRRSGWGDLYKRFGGEKKEAMERFIQEVDSPLTSWQVSEEAKREVEKVRQWFRDEEKHAVGRGIAEVVEQAGEIERKGKVPPKRRERKPRTNLGVVAPKQAKQEESFEEDLKVDPLPLPLDLPRNISDSSSATRNFSGLSHFSVDSSSTSASSFYSASPMAFEVPSPADTFTIAEQSAFVYPSSTQAQEPNPYFSTLADFPYAAMNPLLASQVSFS
uniref:KN homeodomain domain-containing protein n=7 Tax=Leucosporidium scottii TaxID=5278 RepID=A0A0H5FU72_9BASI|nr:hypothetical protein [Leucosporidium scottii]